jgi:hypothetical protein
MSARDIAREEALKRWGAASGEPFVDDVSRRFPWASKHSLQLVLGPGGQRLMVAVGPGDERLPFGDPNDLKNLNRFFDVEFLALPDGLPPDVMAQAMRSFLVGPRGFVGSKAFLEEVVGDEINHWLRKPEDLDAFIKHCADPLVELDGDRWTLRFFFFNERGGVESWSVVGRPNVIDEAKLDVALPDGTLRFPFVD